MDGFLIGAIWGVGLMIVFSLWGIEKALKEICHELKTTKTYLGNMSWQLMLMNDENAEWEHDD